MNHYAIYIWPCYIFAFFLLGLQVILVVIAWKMAVKEVLKPHKDKPVL